MSDSSPQGAPEGANASIPDAANPDATVPAPAPEGIDGAPAPEGAPADLAAQPGITVADGSGVVPEGESVDPDPTNESSQAQLDSPELEKVDADDILPSDSNGAIPATVVTDGSPSIPLQGPVTIGAPADDANGNVRVVAAQGAPTYYSNYADGKSTGFVHPLDAPENRMQVVPGFSMPPGAGVGVPQDLQDRIDAVQEAAQSDDAEPEPEPDDAESSVPAKAEPQA